MSLDIHAIFVNLKVETNLGPMDALQSDVSSVISTTCVSACEGDGKCDLVQ